MAENSEKQNNDDLEDKIQIFSNTDKKLKSLGKMLNNDSSREIIQLLIENEMTATEVATQTKLSLPLTLYHINQMIEAGIVIISKTSNNGKNQPMKYYSAKPGIIILPEKASQKAKESKSFSNSLKRVMKFTVIGFAGIVSWMTVKTYDQGLPIQEPTDEITDTDPSVSVDGAVSPDPDIPTNAESIESLIISIAIPIAVVIVGIILERILCKWLNKRRQKKK